LSPDVSLRKVAALTERSKRGVEAIKFGHPWLVMNDFEGKRSNFSPIYNPGQKQKQTEAHRERHRQTEKKQSRTRLGAERKTDG